MQNSFDKNEWTLPDHRNHHIFHDHDLCYDHDNHQDQKELTAGKLPNRAGSRGDPEVAGQIQCIIDNDNDDDDGGDDGGDDDSKVMNKLASSKLR